MNLAHHTFRGPYGAKQISWKAVCAGGGSGALFGSPRYQIFLFLSFHFVIIVFLVCYVLLFMRVVDVFHHPRYGV